jgi:hypothetical protein
LNDERREKSGQRLEEMGAFLWIELVFLKIEHQLSPAHGTRAQGAWEA